MRIQFWPKVCPKNGKMKVEQAYFCAGDQNKYHVKMEELELTWLLWEFEKIVRAQIYEAMNVVSVYTDPAQTAGYMWLASVLDREVAMAGDMVKAKYPLGFSLGQFMQDRSVGMGRLAEGKPWGSDRYAARGVRKIRCSMGAGRGSTPRVCYQKKLGEYWFGVLRWDLLH